MASEAATWLPEWVRHLNGAQGYMTESPVQRYHRDCRIIAYGEGANEVQREMIFEAVARGGGSRRSPSHLPRNATKAGTIRSWASSWR